MITQRKQKRQGRHKGSVPAKHTPQPKPLTSDEQDILAYGDRICDFLVKSGGAYKRLTGDIQLNVFHALGSRQYVIKEENGEIVYFACYWKVHKEDLESVMERMRPPDISHGTVIYVAEAGNTGGRRGMTDMIRSLRAAMPEFKGALWHRPTKEDHVYNFQRQRGETFG